MANGSWYHHWATHIAKTLSSRDLREHVPAKAIWCGGIMLLKSPQTDEYPMLGNKQIKNRNNITAIGLLCYKQDVRKKREDGPFENKLKFLHNSSTCFFFAVNTQRKKKGVKQYCLSTGLYHHIKLRSYKF